MISTNSHDSGKTNSFIAEKLKYLETENSKPIRIYVTSKCLLDSEGMPGSI